MTTSTSKTYLIIGTAGHIDHGKTRLIGQLTQIDTDRLPEEKSRGISIDLGFAHWETEQFQFGVVDVPGHERFVKNMVAGATGINLALLVVAADDGVMPQTREHLEILDLLDVKHGVVAITKIDLIDDDELLELVKLEVEERIRLHQRNWPVVLVSSETNAGIDELKTAIAEVAAQIEFPKAHDWFRMPIDRVFSLTGHGTVVTGSVLSGEVRAGDVLELLPDGKEVRVRSIEHHGLLTDEGTPRQRTALNLANVKHDELHRGQELATPQMLQPSTRLLVKLKTEPESRRVIQNRDEFFLHLGTSETACRVVLKGDDLGPNSQTVAELRTREAVVAAYGQRFILRQISPAETVAGGMILDPGIPVFKRLKSYDEPGEFLASDDPRVRLEWLFSQLDEIPESPNLAAWRAGVLRDEYPRLLGELQTDGTLQNVGAEHHPHWVHVRRLDNLSETVMRIVRETIETLQPRRALPKNRLLTACREVAPRKLLEVVFVKLHQTGQLAKIGSQYGPADLQVKLTRRQQQLRQELLELYAEANLKPPTLKELAEQFDQPETQIEPLLTLCTEDGLLVKLSESLYFTPEAIECARRQAAELFQQQPSATTSQLREAWGSTRKFAVPLCEFLDTQQMTRREENQRFPGPRIECPFATDSEEELSN